MERTIEGRDAMGEGDGAGGGTGERAATAASTLEADVSRSARRSGLCTAATSDGELGAPLGGVVASAGGMERESATGAASAGACAAAVAATGSAVLVPASATAAVARD